jgi:hypothetical protein
MADNLLMSDFASGRSLGLRFRACSLTHAEPITLRDAIRRDMPCVAEGEKFGFLQPVIRRDFLERHRIRYAEEVRAGEDWLLYATCIAHGARFHTVPDGYYVLPPARRLGDREPRQHPLAERRQPPHPPHLRAPRP